MSIADGSQVRLADVSEVTIGTTPSTPAFQVMRYTTSDLRLQKTTDITDEVRADRNVPGVTDVGRAVQGTVNTRFSYGTYDTWLSRLFCAAWSADTLVNGVTHMAATLEQFYEQGATDSFTRFNACRWNTLDLRLEARKAVTAAWNIMGIKAPPTGTAIIAGATYAAPTLTDEFNAGLNVANLAVTGVTNSPKMMSLSLKITNNLYANDIVGAYETYSHGLGRFEVSGSMNTYFESKDVYDAIIAHTTLGLSFDLTDAAGNSYTVQIPKIKPMDGGPQAPGNGKAVMLEVPFQAIYDDGIAGAIKITREDAA